MRGAFILILFHEDPPPIIGVFKVKKTSLWAGEKKILYSYFSLNSVSLLLFLSEQSQQLDSLKTQEYLAQLPLALLTFPC